MEAAEDTTRRILQRGRESLDRQLEELIRTRTEIAAEIEDLMTWREAAGALHGLTEDTRILIREVPGRLRDALVPLDSAVIKLDETLDQVSDLPDPRRLASAPDPDGSGESGPLVTMDDDGSTVSYTPTGGSPPPMPAGHPPPRAV
jgi:hypothetical protein